MSCSSKGGECDSDPVGHDDDVASLLGSLRGGARSTGQSSSAVAAAPAINRDLLKKARPRAAGPGLRIRDCEICQKSSSSGDPIIEHSFLAWAHMDDAVTIQGHICHYCNTILRRRWKGWKLVAFRREMSSNESVAKLFWSLVARLIECLKSGSGRVSSLALDVPAQSVNVSHSVEEKFELRGWLFLPRHVHVELHGCEGEEMGLTPETHQIPGGEPLTGFRILDTGARPLPHPDIVPISRSFKKVDRT